jgi:hypothetical protein
LSSISPPRCIAASSSRLAKRGSAVDVSSVMFTNGSHHWSSCNQNDDLIL